MINHRRLLGVGLGSALEWYDFALYGFFAPIFAKQYFPPSDEQANLIGAFGIFAIGFLVRPIGGLIFGRFGDKYGRVNCLKITPILLTIPTVLIALLPPYADIGIWASILLFMTRIIQGLFIGGEYAGNMVYMCESAGHKRYFYGSLASCTGSFGIFIASLISSLVYQIFSKDFAEMYGWRIAFLLSIFLGIAAFLMRRNISETEDFQKLKLNKNVSLAPVFEAIRYDWRACLVGLCMLILHATTFYAVFTFMPTLIAESDATIPGLALKYVSIFLFVRLFIIPVIGLCAQKLGGKIMMRISSILFMILSYWLFSIISHSRGLLPIVALGVFALMTSINAGTVPGLLAEILPSRTRYTTFSFTFNAGFGVFGGIAPLVLQTIIRETGQIQHAAYYLVISAVIAFIGTFFIESVSKEREIPLTAASLTS